VCVCACVRVCVRAGSPHLSGPDRLEHAATRKVLDRVSWLLYRKRIGGRGGGGMCS
jgi:hypothetical protein